MSPVCLRPAVCPSSDVRSDAPALKPPLLGLETSPPVGSKGLKPTRERSGASPSPAWFGRPPSGECREGRATVVGVACRGPGGGSAGPAKPGDFCPYGGRRGRGSFTGQVGERPESRCLQNRVEMTHGDRASMCPAWPQAGKNGVHLRQRCSRPPSVAGRLQDRENSEGELALVRVGASHPNGGRIQAL